MFKRLYDWTLRLAESPRATWALAIIAFAESSFFPIPPDVILVPMSLAQPKKAWFYAGVCTLASVMGGALGYAIGYLLYDTLGAWIVQVYHLGDKLDNLRACSGQVWWLVILAKGLTPIPFKLITIATGVIGYSFFKFLGLATLTRGARFFILAILMRRFGDQIKAALDRHFATFIILIIAIIVAGFWLATHYGNGGACGA